LLIDLKNIVFKRFEKRYFSILFPNKVFDNFVFVLDSVRRRGALNVLIEIDDLMK